jgi:hypothetical protein
VSFRTFPEWMSFWRAAGNSGLVAAIASFTAAIYKDKEKLKESNVEENRIIMTERL